MLAKLQKQQSVEKAEIITLAFHVDYWDYLGWKDEFSSPKYGARQNEYVNALGVRGNYTPQMIVDGRVEFVGSREETALNEIEKSVLRKKGDVEISVVNGTDLSVEFSNLPASKNSDVWLAITEDGLETNVKRGENGGRKLSHESVVREFVSLGKIEGDQVNFSAKGKISIKPEWKKENLNIVVFAQNAESKEVIAIGKIKFD